MNKKVRKLWSIRKGKTFLPENLCNRHLTFKLQIFKALNLLKSKSFADRLPAECLSIFRGLGKWRNTIGQERKMLTFQGPSKLQGRQSQNVKTKFVFQMVDPKYKSFVSAEWKSFETKIYRISIWPEHSMAQLKKFFPPNPLMYSSHKKVAVGRNINSRKLRKTTNCLIWTSLATLYVFQLTEVDLLFLACDPWVFTNCSGWVLSLVFWDFSFFSMLSLGVYDWVQIGFWFLFLGVFSLF